MRGVEAVACKDDFASVEHALKHLFHKGMILTGRVEARRVGTSPTPTMDGDVVFAFLVGGGGLTRVGFSLRQPEKSDEARRKGE